METAGCNRLVHVDGADRLIVLLRCDSQSFVIYDTDSRFKSPLSAVFFYLSIHHRDQVPFNKILTKQLDQIPNNEHNVCQSCLADGDVRQTEHWRR